MTDAKLPLTGWKTDNDDPRYFGEPGKVVSDEYEPTHGEGRRCVVLSANMNFDNRAEVAELAARAPALLVENETLRAERDEARAIVRWHYGLSADATERPTAQQDLATINRWDEVNQ